MKVQPFKPVRKVVIVGPECTGKSALSAFLAEHFKTVWVPEYARQYIDNLGRAYVESDLPVIARGQLQLEDKLEKEANRVLFCDTNLYVIKVWSNFVYGRVHPEILSTIRNRSYDLYLLTNIDIPWEEDPLREHPLRREELYHIYLNEMKNQEVPFVQIKGEREERRKAAIHAVETLLNIHE